MYFFCRLKACTIKRYQSTRICRPHWSKSSPRASPPTPATRRAFWSHKPRENCRNRSETRRSVRCWASSTPSDWATWRSAKNTRKSTCTRSTRSTLAASPCRPFSGSPMGLASACTPRALRSGSWRGILFCHNSLLCFDYFDHFISSQ